MLFAPIFAHAATSVPPTEKRHTVRVAYYNVKWFGQGTSAKDIEGLAHVFKHFDAVAVIEVRKEAALARLTSKLEEITKKQWGYVFGVRTHSPQSRYYEAYGVIWNRDRLQFGNGLVSGVWDKNEVFRNDPYIASFSAGAFNFRMLMVHTRWSEPKGSSRLGPVPGTRAGEVLGVADQLDYLRGYLPDDLFLVGGDFNYPGHVKEMRVLEDRAHLKKVNLDEPTTYSQNTKNCRNCYDHIYATKSMLNHVACMGQALNVVELIQRDPTVNLTPAEAKALSDHLPVFVELSKDRRDAAGQVPC